jgi:hypothetical protein
MVSQSRSDSSERIGLDTDAQAEKLRTHAVLAAGLRVFNVELGGRVRSVMAIIHTKLPFWLATISPEQVNDETRPKLIQYQTELADILARLFYGEPAGHTALGRSHNRRAAAAVPCRPERDASDSRDDHR